VTRTSRKFVSKVTRVLQDITLVKVLNILQKHRLYLKVEKCIFEQPKVKYLSFILSEGCVEVDPVKAAGIQDWPTPKYVTEVQSFVGFVYFY